MGDVTPLPLSYQSGPDSKLLDRVLEGLDAEQRARVLDLVVRLGIEADDPLFLISLATSQLQVLVQDAPNNWINLFSVFEEDMEQWQKQNLNTLETLALEAQAVHGLTESSKTLNNHISSLQEVLLQLIETLEKSNSSSQEWQQAFKALKTDLVLTVSNSQNSPPAIQPAIAQPSPPRNGTSTSGGKPVLLCVMVFTFFSVNLGIMRVQQSQTLHYRQLEQLIEQQSHSRLLRDCLNGTLPMDSPACQ